jgi:hypothetical protein
MKRSLIISLFIAGLLGILAAWIDSRPNWDDTGISVVLILAIAALCGFMAGQKPWLLALASGIWIPLAGIAFTQNFGSLLALIPAFLGAYAGFLARKVLAKK